MAGILGSFDPNLKQEQLAKYQVKFGVDGVHLIQRSKFFLFVKIIIPLILYILLYTVTMIGVGYFSASDPQVIGYSAIIGLLFVLILFLTLNFKRLLDYLMDFILITPDQIIAFNQKGIWKRSNISIETIKIKSISVSYRSWIFSLFNNGDITFLSE
ncbi:MAG: hypothetical protein H6766_01640 [Candidatus Peribacteria bacterium]|nr:MAG: hypothetical protein H6766_01640 [Candidatus Peribacteria bacterium]